MGDTVQGTLKDERELILNALFFFVRKAHDIFLTKAKGSHSSEAFAAPAATRLPTAIHQAVHTHVSRCSQAIRQTYCTRKRTCQEQGRSSELPATEARTMGREHERIAAASGLLTPRTATATTTWENRDMRNQ